MSTMRPEVTGQGGCPLPHTFGLTRASYSVAEALSHLAIGRTTFYELVAAGEIKLIKFGKRSVVGADNIAEVLQRRREAA
jgi:excisionase family DNA binding protein